MAPARATPRKSPRSPIERSRPVGKQTGGAHAEARGEETGDDGEEDVAEGQAVLPVPQQQIGFDGERGERRVRPAEAGTGGGSQVRVGPQPLERKDENEPQDERAGDVGRERRPREAALGRRQGLADGIPSRTADRAADGDG